MCSQVEWPVSSFTPRPTGCVTVYQRQDFCWQNKWNNVYVSLSLFHRVWFEYRQLIFCSILVHFLPEMCLELQNISLETFRDLDCLQLINSFYLWHFNNKKKLYNNIPGKVNYITWWYLTYFICIYIDAMYYLKIKSLVCTALL